MKKIGLLCFVVPSFLLSSCLKDKTMPVIPSDCPTIISYSLDIVPIINTSCVTNQGPGTGCHDAWIFDYNNIVGQMEANKWQNTVINLRTMPQIPNVFGIDSLTADEYQLMKCWINQGYPDN